MNKKAELAAHSQIAIMSDFEEFNRARVASVERLQSRDDLRRAWIDFLQKATAEGYLHNFDWLGLPIIQLPQDMQAIQELVCASSRAPSSRRAWPVAGL